jgi:hypothetical protein
LAGVGSASAFRKLRPTPSAFNRRRDAITLPFETHLIPTDVEVGRAVEEGAAIDFLR